MRSGARVDPFAVTTHMLGGSGRWQNLGLWPARTYDEACERLALTVGEAARLRPGARVLDVGAGTGASLDLWREHFGAAPLGLDPHPRASRPDLIANAAIRGQHLAVPGPFDAIVAVDSAYHFGPLSFWLDAAHAELAPGGRLAFTTLAAGPPWSWLGRLADIPRGAVVPGTDIPSILSSAGFRDVVIRDLTGEVLGGFADHVASLGHRHGRGWTKIALTARLSRIGSSSGALAYLLVSARRPPPEPLP